MERNKESLDKEFALLMAEDYTRLDVQDLVKFINFLNSEDRYEMLLKSIPEDPHIYMTFTKYDIVHFLHLLRSKKI